MRTLQRVDMKRTIIGVQGRATQLALIVAVVTYENAVTWKVLDWTAYFGGADSGNHIESPADQVGKHGDKIGEKLAVFIFGPDSRFKLPAELYRD